ncbi:hypothetical protein PT974_07148 [Cladobotryum mycophilum]|uniref:CipC protein n=1 Tax=Cladobotryum mycophilum TaxID=491253 RepID=A0ABR0SNK1_9HYPO
MGWFSDDSDQSSAYDQYNGLEEHHEASLTHELLSGAVAYEAAKAYEEHCAENGEKSNVHLCTSFHTLTKRPWQIAGEPDDHAKAKEIFAGFAGAILDREIETRGLDWIDRERAQNEAEDHFSNEYQNRYN